MVVDSKMSRSTDPELPEGPLDGEGFILAGGKSGRLGQDKAFLHYRGSPLIQVARRCLESVGLPVTIVADSGERFRSLGLPVLVDRVSGAGPLAAVFTALTASRSQANYFIPCDTPWFPPGSTGFWPGPAAISTWWFPATRQAGSIPFAPPTPAMPRTRFEDSWKPAPAGSTRCWKRRTCGFTSCRPPNGTCRTKVSST